MSMIPNQVESGREPMASMFGADLRSDERRWAMRLSRWIALVALLAALPRTSRATEPPAPDAVLYTASVVPLEAEVRCGPGNSPRLYPTNRLKKGDRVEVVRELQDGWLAIKPPPGSFSWINMRFLQDRKSTRLNSSH